MKPIEENEEGTEPDVKWAARAEAEREKAWQEDGEAEWNGQRLQSWSRARETLLARLVAVDVPGGALEDLAAMQARLDERKAQDPGNDALQAATLEGFVNVMEYLPTAAKVLYLAAHEPQEWDHLRGVRVTVFLRAIEEWAETAIEPGAEWKAVMTAVNITTAHRQMVAMRRPTPGTRNHAGN